MKMHGIEISERDVAEFCRRHGVKRLSLYGSFVRDDFGPESDIDMLAEFAGPTPSLFKLGGMLMELREMTGRDIDLKTPGFLTEYFSSRIMREARVLYAA